MTKEKKSEKREDKRESVGGAIDDAKGRVKEAFGALTDDEDMKREGRVDRAAGEAKNKVSEAVDQVRDGINSLLEKDEKKNEQ